MVNASENKYFRNTEMPFVDIAHMLSELDEKGLIPAAMREAIRQHASNFISTMPLTIAAIASTLATASTGSSGPDKFEVENTSRGIAALSEQLHGWNELAYCFGVENHEAVLEE